MTRVHLTWDKGGTAEIVSISNEAATLRSTTPAPPGSRIDGTLIPEGGPDGAPSGAPSKVRFKVHGSKRQADGGFVIVGRPIDLPKDLRQRLEILATG